MNTRRMLAIALRYLYLLRGSPARVVPLFAWVAVDIILWGFLTRYLGTCTSGGPDFVALLLGAVLLWDFFIRVMQGVTMAFFEDVWTRNFLNFFASPLGISEYVGGLVLSSIITSAIGLLVMLFLASALFGLSYLSWGLLLLPFLLILFAFGIAMGVFAAALVLRWGPAAEWLVWPIPALLSPFVGVFYPVSTLPLWMQAVAHTLPPSCVFEAVRALASGGTPSAGLLAGGIGLAVCYVFLACLFFVRTYRHAIRTGLIPRYSAESLS